LKLVYILESTDFFGERVYLGGVGSAARFFARQKRLVCGLPTGRFNPKPSLSRMSTSISDAPVNLITKSMTVPPAPHPKQ
jgi:hypothetical protein